LIGNQICIEINILDRFLIETVVIRYFTILVISPLKYIQTTKNNSILNRETKLHWYIFETKMSIYLLHIKILRVNINLFC
jgi:hypothetical protein